MINTPAFESLMRYKKLREALDFIEDSYIGYPTTYGWMRQYIAEALRREGEFASANREAWEKEEEV